MTNKLGYTIDNLALLQGIKVIVTDFVPDNIIVLKAPKPAKSWNLASFYISMWYLDGEHKDKIIGDCDITKTTEMYMSPIRFEQMKRMVEEADFSTALFGEKK